MFSTIKRFLPVLIPLILTLSISYYFQYKVLANQEQFTLWLANFGPFIIVIYLILQALTIVIATIGGFFLVVAMMALIGPEKAMILGYFATTPVYLLNFWLARKYGRPFVKRMLGHEAMLKIDHLVKDAGLAILIMTRVLQSANFDYVSYGWGLTTVSFKMFAVVNIVAGIPGALITYIVVTRFSNVVYGVLAFYLTSALLTGLAIYLTQIMKRSKPQQ